MHQACKLTIIDDQHNITDTKNLQNNIRILLCTLVIIINKTIRQFSTSELGSNLLAYKHYCLKGLQMLNISLNNIY